MEELEKLINRCKECKFATCEQCEISYTEVKAIEDLIARYKEYKKITEAVKLLETEKVPDDTYYVIAKTSFLKGDYEHLLDDYIPKSKVKEKIEELKKYGNNLTEEQRQKETEFLQGKLKAYEELLED